VTNGERCLIVNADDFGRSPGINDGVLRAHREGIVTSASLMVRWPAAVEAARYAREHPHLSVGLHLDFGEWSFRDGEWVPEYEVVADHDAEALRADLRLAAGHEDDEMLARIDVDRAVDAVGPADLQEDRPGPDGWPSVPWPCARRSRSVGFAVTAVLVIPSGPVIRSGMRLSHGAPGRSERP